MQRKAPVYPLVKYGGVSLVIWSWFLSGLPGALNAIMKPEKHQDSCLCQAVKIWTQMKQDNNHTHTPKSIQKYLEICFTVVISFAHMTHMNFM